MLRIVRVAGNEMHQVAVHQFGSRGSGAPSEPTQQGARSHLHERTIFDPGLHLIEAAVQEAIAFGMRDDRSQTRAHEAGKDLLGGAGNQQVGEFHQEIAEVIDGVLVRVRQRVLYILRAEMEVTPAVDARLRAGGSLKLDDFPGNQFGIESKLAVGVRGGYDIGGPGIGRQTEHRHGIVEGAGPIVETIENMTVDIYHS